MRPARRAEQERTRHADELHDDERGDLRVAIDADLGAVDRRHADDRLDAVVVEQERQQHQERLPVAAQLVERSPDPPERRRARPASAAASPARAMPAAPARAGRAAARTAATTPPTLTNDSLMAATGAGEAERRRAEESRPG